MAKDKIKLVFEIDRFKVIGCVARNCETKEEYDELVKIINGTDEVVRNDKEIEKTNCVLILDQLLHNNHNALLGVRLKEKEAELEATGENEEEAEEVAGAIEITGEEAKSFIDYVKKLIAKKKEGE